MEEIWKDIVGFEGLYKISNKGHVINNEGRLIKEYFNKTAKTVFVKLYNPVLKKDISKTVGFLVAEHFLIKPADAKKVRHLNNNPLDKSVENIQWIERIIRIPTGKPRGLGKSQITTILENTPIIGYLFEENEDNITVTLYKGETEIIDEVPWKGIKDITSHFNKHNGLDEWVVGYLADKLRERGFRLRRDAHIEIEEDVIKLSYHKT